MAVYSRIFTDVQTSVIEKLRLDATLDATKVSEYINQALAQAAIDTGYFTGSTAGSALAAAATTQSLPTTIISLEYISSNYGGQQPLLREATFEQVLYFRGLGAAAGPPMWYALRQGTVELYPAAVGGEILTYYGAVLPEEWTGSTASPLPEPYTSVIEAGALYYAAEFKKDPLVAQYLADYESWRKRWKSYVNMRTGARPRKFYVGGPGRWPYPNPSTDVPWLP